MRRLSALFFLLTSALVSFGITIEDVSPEIEEYPIIVYLLENGIMDFVEDHKFGGSLVVSRYELARYLYNLIKFVKRGAVEESPTSELLSPIEELYHLLGYDPERKELARLVSIEDRIRELEKKSIETEKKLADVNDRITESVKSLNDKILALDEKKSEEIGKVKGDLMKHMEGLQKEIGDLRMSYSRLDTLATALTLEISRNSSEIKEIRGMLEDFQKALSGIQVSGLQPASVGVGAEDLRNELNNLKILVQKIADKLGMTKKLKSEGDTLVTVLAPGATSLVVYEGETTIPTSLVDSLKIEIASEVMMRVEEMVPDSESRILENASKSLKEEVENLRKELEEEMRSFETEMASRMETLEASSLKKDVESLRRDMEERFADLEREFTIWLLISIVLTIFLSFILAVLL